MDGSQSVPLLLDRPRPAGLEVGAEDAGAAAAALEDAAAGAAEETGVPQETQKRLAAPTGEPQLVQNGMTGRGGD